MPHFETALSAALERVNAGDYARAEDQCLSILMQRPHHPGATYLLGTIARLTGRFALAVDCLREALPHLPHAAEVQVELGLILQQLGQLSGAEAAFRAAIAMQPELQTAHLNLSALLTEMQQFKTALTAAQTAVKLSPDCPLAHYNLGTILRALRRNDEAIAAFEQAIALDAQFAKAHWNLSLACLSAGEFAKGWWEYEWRETVGQAEFDRFPGPRWQGQALRDKTLVIHAEQGIGDEILFASCYPDIIPQAKQTILVCDPRLQSLFARSFPTTQVIGHRRRADLQPPNIATEYDLQVPAGSVPQFVRSSVDSFPQRRRFLLPNPVARRTWLQTMGALGSGLKVGISWRAGGQPSEHRRRTIALQEWREVLTIPGVQFVNLQYGEATVDLEDISAELGVMIHDLPGGDPLLDLDSFAAKVAALDLVISVGNATVHLAGALGIRTWAIVPEVPAWRWMLSGEQSLWYPSVRMFRQTAAQSWCMTLARIAEELRVEASSASNLTLALGPVVAPELKTVSAPRRKVAANTSPLKEVHVLRNWSDLGTVFEQAERAFKGGDMVQAESLCREILQHSPRYVPALRLSSWISRHNSRFEDALRTLSLAAAIEVSDAHLQWELGGLRQTLGDRAGAKACYERAAQLRPDFAKPHNALGGIQMEQGHYEAAIAAFQRAIAIQPDYMAAHNNLGSAYEKLGELPLALASFERAMAIDPNSPVARKNFDQVQQRMQTQHPSGVPAPHFNSSVKSGAENLRRTRD